MITPCRRQPVRKGTVAVAAIMVLLLTSLFIIGIVSGAARDQDLSARRLETVQAFYAAEAGMNMAYRELMLGADEDGDGTIGSISDDANDMNDPGFGLARVFVSQTPLWMQTQLESHGRTGAARRKIVAIVD